MATFSSAIHDAQPGRLDYLDDELATYLTALRDAATAARGDIDPSPNDPKAAAARSEAIAALTEIADTASPGAGLVRPADPRPHRGGVAGPRGRSQERSDRGSSGRCCGWRRCRWPACCAPGCSTAPQRF